MSDEKEPAKQDLSLFLQAHLEGDTKTAKKLTEIGLESGNEEKEVSSQGRSPLDFVKRTGNEKLKNLLKKHGANPGNEETEKGR